MPGRLHGMAGPRIHTHTHTHSSTPHDAERSQSQSRRRRVCTPGCRQDGSVWRCVAGPGGGGTASCPWRAQQLLLLHVYVGVGRPFASGRSSRCTLGHCAHWHSHPRPPSHLLLCVFRQVMRRRLLFLWFCCALTGRLRERVCVQQPNEAGHQNIACGRGCAVSCGRKRQGWGRRGSQWQRCS